MIDDEPTLSTDRLTRRREHLMREIRTAGPDTADLTAEDLTAVDLDTADRDRTDAADPDRSGSARVPAQRTSTALDGSPRPQRRRRAGRLGALSGVGALIAAGVIGLAVSMSSGPGGSGHPALAIQRLSNDTVAVQIVDSSAGAAAMTRQLHDQGLNVTIDTYPSSPQLVGDWVSASFSGGVPKSVVRQVEAQVPNGYAITVDLPAKFKGWIRFGVGRAPVAGEALWVSGWRNALAPGARLGCLHATSGDPQEVAQAVRRLGYTVGWANGDLGLSLPTPEQVARPAAGQKVTVATIDDARPAQVTLFAATPGTRRYTAEAHLGYAPSQWDTRDSNPATCTPAPPQPTPIG